MAEPDLPRPRRGAAAGSVELGKRFGFEIDPDEQGRLAVGRLAAAGRDPQGALPQRADPRPRRADRRPDAAGDRGDLRASCAGSPSEGHSIIFISHKLYEVLEIADRITVIRRGKVVGQRIPSETDEDDLAELMVGRERAADGRPRRVATRPSRCSTVDRPAASRTTAGSEVVRGVELRGPRRRDPRHRRRRRQRPGRARRGDRSGCAKPAGGTVTLDGRDVTGRVAARAARAGRRLRARRPPPLRPGAAVPARPTTSSSPTTTARRTPAGIVRNDEAIARAPARRDRRSTTSARRRPTSAPARCPAATSRRSSSPASSSGDLKLLVLDQPTRGLDVGSIEFIHRQVIAKRDAGTAILLVSAELDEVLELSDRIARHVPRARSSPIVDGRTADKEEVGLLMATGGDARHRGGGRGRAARDATAATAGGRRSGRSADARPRRACGRLACPLISILLALVVGAVVMFALRARSSGSRLDPPLPLTAYRALVDRAPSVRLNAIVEHARPGHAAGPRPASRSASASRPACSTSAARASS